MKIQFLVTCEVERKSGKFESKDDLAEAICDEISSANPEEISGPQYEGEFEITEWTVERYEDKTK